MCFYYDECCEYWDESIVTARKPHKCCSCARGIAPGEQYVKVFSVFEGEADTRKLCNLCEQDRRAIERWERAQGCHGAEASPPLEDIHDLIRNGDRDEWHEEFEGDEDGGVCLFWPYGIPPAARQADLKKLAS